MNLLFSIKSSKNFRLRMSVLHFLILVAYQDLQETVFIAALFTTTSTWKQPKCPSTDEWIKTIQYIFTMEYYSALKKNEFESVVVRWMKLEPVMQGEVSQKEKNKYCILIHIYGNQNISSDGPICREEMEMQTQRMDLWTQWGKRGKDELRKQHSCIYTVLCSAQPLSHVQLFATFWTLASQAHLSTGILQARILE